MYEMKLNAACGLATEEAKIKNNLFNLYGFVELGSYMEQNSNSSDKF